MAKTSQLSGIALDYAVALAEGFGPRQYMRSIDVRLNVEGKASALLVPINRAYVIWTPTTCQQGDAIIDREKISTTINHNGTWLAYIGYNLNDEQLFMMAGATRREAAMRCYVASKLGDEVEIPKELING